MIHLVRVVLVLSATIALHIQAADSLYERPHRRRPIKPKVWLGRPHVFTTSPSPIQHSHCSAALDEFECSEHDTHLCIPGTAICDGNYDCTNGADEDRNFCSSCEYHGCSNECLLTARGPRCLCPEGTQLSAINAKKCEPTADGIQQPPSPPGDNSADSASDGDQNPADLYSTPLVLAGIGSALVAVVGICCARKRRRKLSHSSANHQNCESFEEEVPLPPLPSRGESTRTQSCSRWDSCAYDVRMAHPSCVAFMHHASPMVPLRTSSLGSTTASAGAPREHVRSYQLGEEIAEALAMMDQKEQP